MISIRACWLNQAPEGDDRIRTGVPVLGALLVYEPGTISEHRHPSFDANPGGKRPGFQHEGSVPTDEPLTERGDPAEWSAGEGETAVDRGQTWPDPRSVSGSLDAALAEKVRAIRARETALIAGIAYYAGTQQ